MTMHSVVHPFNKMECYLLLSRPYTSLKWWLTKYFANCVDIFHMCPEIGIIEFTLMEFTFQDVQKPSVFVTRQMLAGVAKIIQQQPCRYNSEVLGIE